MAISVSDFFFWFFKELAPVVREAQEKKLEDLRKQNDLQQRLAIERRIFLHDRKIKFFGTGLVPSPAVFHRHKCRHILMVSALVAERRKIERGIRRIERMQRTAADHLHEALLSDQLAKLREDLEYVRVSTHCETEYYFILVMINIFGETLSQKILLSIWTSFILLR